MIEHRYCCNTGACDGHDDSAPIMGRPSTAGSALVWASTDAEPPTGADELRWAERALDWDALEAAWCDATGRELAASRRRLVEAGAWAEAPRWAAQVWTQHFDHAMGLDCGKGCCDS
jgi:hypothetical protein